MAVLFRGRFVPLWIVLVLSVGGFAFMSACSGGDDDDDDEGGPGTDDDADDDDAVQDRFSRFVLVTPTGVDETLTLAIDDARSLLVRVVGPADVMVASAPTDDDGALTIVFESPGHSSVFSDAELAAISSEGYRLRRAPSGPPMVAIGATDSSGAQYGLYRLLEVLGLRFFHPEQTYWPGEGSLAVPADLDMDESPAFGRRGFHIHTMHPIEASEFLLKPGEQHLEWAQHLIDWHVRNRQNYMQWELLRTVPYNDAVDYFRQIVDYAHRRGMKIGVVVTWVFQQQKAWKIVPAFWCECRDEMEANIDKLMQVPWDHLHLEMGTTEFTPTDPDLQVAWMNNTAEYLAENYPATDCSVKVHVSSGQFAEDYGVNFNFLAEFADPRVGVYPHTVQFYDLLGPAPAYENESFEFMYDWMLDRVGERKVYFYPETAYWVSFDIDVPLFLPIYARNRWRDIKLLADKGIDGHVTFSSGHEWNYWFNDWVTARETFTPSNDERGFIDVFTGIFGEAGPALADAIAELADHQDELLIHNEMVSYVTGQDTFDEIGYLIGGSTQPKPVMFSDIDKMDETALGDFETSTLQRLLFMAEFASDLADEVDGLADLVPASAWGWYEELRDGFRVDALRTNHSYSLYAGAVARRWADLGVDPDGADLAQVQFDHALEVTEDFIALMNRREAHYRYPLEYSSSWQRSVTSYDFRYLWQAHTAYWYRRAEAQAIDKQFSPFLMNVIDPLWFMF